MNAPKSVRPVRAVNAALGILRYLGNARGPAGVSEIARSVAIYPSTCFQILWTLIGEQAVVFHPESKTYSLGLGLVELSQGALKSGFLEIARPGMRRLSDRHDVPIFLLHRIRADTLVLLEHVRSGVGVDLHPVIGAPVSAWQGAVGRVAAAVSGLAEDALRAGFAGAPWQDPPPFERWLDDVRQAASTGFAIDRGHRFRGITGMAAAVYDRNGGANLFLATACVTAQVDDRRLDAIGGDLRDEARQVGEALRRQG